MTRRALGVDGELLEAAWQTQVVGLARIYGWRPFHAPDGGHAPRAGGRRLTGGQLPEGRGFPDLLLLKGPRLVVAELKSRTGKLGPGQNDWLDAFRIVGAAVADMDAQLDEDGRGAGLVAGVAPSVEAYLWRPDDWEEVQQVLGRGQERRVDLDPLPA